MILSGSDTEHVGKSLAQSAFFRKAMQDGFGAENSKGSDGKPQTVMAVGIEDAQGKRIGVLVATLNMEAIGRQCTDKITLSATGISMIYPLIGEYAQIRPDFEHKVLKGSIFVKGKIRMLYALIFAWNMLWDKNVRTTYRHIRRFKL